MSDAPAQSIDIQDSGLLGQITVRGALSAPPMRSAVDMVTGLQVPDALGVTHSGDRRVVWMSPDELLLIGPRDAVQADCTTLSQRLSGQQAMALDVSDARCVLRLGGARVGECLAKGAPCDMSDRGFPPGTARRTHLAGLAVAIWRLSDHDWEIACFRSYQQHLSDWLAVVSISGAEVA